MSKNAGLVGNSVDADETPHSAESHLGLHCLIRPVYPYGNTLKIAGQMENRLDADETPHSAESRLDLHCLLRPACPNTYRTEGTVTNFAYDVLAM